MDRIQILQTLNNDVHEAKERYDVAFKRFREIVSDVPSGIPHPDGSERVRLASREYKHGLEALNTALFKLNHYVIHGTIPPDLKETRGRKQSDTQAAEIWV
jgi:hypothetical protein